MVKIGSITVTPASSGDPLASRILERFPGAGTFAQDPDHKPARRRGPDGPRVILARNSGRFVKDFPRVPGSPPCGEKYIASIQGCPFDCSYCYLRSYLGHGDIVVFTNTEQMRSEIKEALRSPGLARITTGEMSDSLALDHITGTVMEILPLFEGTGVLLEARTKSAEVDHLIESLSGGRGSAGGRPSPGGIRQPLSTNLTVTWTLAPASAISAEERMAAPLGERLSAMARSSEAGMRIGIRFDPVIPAYYSEREYASLVEDIARRISPGTMRRFEIGILRFPPGLWEKVRSSDPSSLLFKGEYLRDREGKMRFYRPGRVRIYREIAGLLKAFFPSVPIELSMEDGSVWEEAGLEPSSGTQTE